MEKKFNVSAYGEMAIQPLEYISKNRLQFSEGNIIKLATRHPLKGKELDMVKVIDYAMDIAMRDYRDNAKDFMMSVISLITKYTEMLRSEEAEELLQHAISEKEASYSRLTEQANRLLDTAEKEGCMKELGKELGEQEAAEEEHEHEEEAAHEHDSATEEDDSNEGEEHAGSSEDASLETSTFPAYGRTNTYYWYKAGRLGECENVKELAQEIGIKDYRSITGMFAQAKPDEYGTRHYCGVKSNGYHIFKTKVLIDCWSAEDYEYIIRFCGIKRAVQ